MALTKEDLTAITEIVEAKVTAIVGGAEQRIMKHVTKEIDDLAIDTAKGFEEVHQKIAVLQDEVVDVKHTVNRIEQVQRAEISRVDSQEAVIKKFKKAFQAVA
jgi:hypothetical protein